MEDSEGMAGLDYWLQWQVVICAVIVVVPTAIAIRVLRKRSGAGAGPLKPVDMWAPCWRYLHPLWLLFYRAFAFVAMVFLLYQTVAAFGFFVFFFYTRWTFALVMIYFAVATIVSLRGCRIHARKSTQSGERDKILKKDSEESNNGSKHRESKGIVKLELHNSNPDDQLGFLENLLPMVYHVRFHQQWMLVVKWACAGAVILTDIVFWGLLLPFMTGEDFQLTLLLRRMHSVNAVFLIIESALNRLPFTWFGLVYFVLWSFTYIIFQWSLHACCFTWWPYPFLDLSPSSAPLWYLALALVHLPCYGLYVWLTKAKHAAFSKMFPQAFVRST